VAGQNCINAREPISRDVERELFARAAGHCQRPVCRRDMFIDVGVRRVSIAEMAHIIAATPDGPRGRSATPAASRSRINNLLLLCSSCHTLIDKAPKEFSNKTLKKWKTEHEASIRAYVGVVEHPSREAARGELSPMLAKNLAVFKAYGPVAPDAGDPGNETVRSWHRKMLEIVLPTNRRILILPLFSGRFDYAA
jgi:hypothetical protein